MRVFVPTTLNGLKELRANGITSPVAAHTVTPALREWYVEGDGDELEYAAASDAASASLRLLRADQHAAPRRVVLAAEVPDDAVRAGSSGTRSAVVLGVDLTLDRVVSVHLDDSDAEPDVTAAVRAVDAADTGDEDAQFVVDGAEGHELLWYDVTELDDLL